MASGRMASASTSSVSAVAKRGVGRAAHVRRYTEIVAILVRYGFVDVVEALHLRPYLAAGRRMLSTFGRPLRTERKPDGSEDWFYNFGTQDRESRPFAETVASERNLSYSFGRTTTTTTTMTPLPVHLSPEGRVVGEIPAGTVISE